MDLVRRRCNIRLVINFMSMLQKTIKTIKIQKKKKKKKIAVDCVTGVASKSVVIIVSFYA